MSAENQSPDWLENVYRDILYGMIGSAIKQKRPLSPDICEDPLHERSAFLRLSADTKTLLDILYQMRKETVEAINACRRPVWGIRQIDTVLEQWETGSRHWIIRRSSMAIRSQLMALGFIRDTAAPLYQEKHGHLGARLYYLEDLILAQEGIKNDSTVEDSSSIIITDAT